MEKRNRFSFTGFFAVISAVGVLELLRYGGRLNGVILVFQCLISGVLTGVFWFLIGSVVKAVNRKNG